MLGLHIISDLKQIDFSMLKLSEDILENKISGLLNKYGLSELGNYYHTFNKNNEITCIVALAESHISIHTWPEKQYVSLDIFVCNLGEDNSIKAKKIYQDLIDFFSPKDIEEHFIKRKTT